MKKYGKNKINFYLLSASNNFEGKWGRLYFSIHLMIEPLIDGSLPKIMMRLTLAYSSYFNRKYRGVGHVWQGRYKSSIIDKDNYLIWCGLYIEINPLRAGLVEKPEDWQFSSYEFYAFSKAHPLIEKLIDIDPYYYQGLGNSLKERQERYRQYINDVIDETFLKGIRDQLNEGVFGEKKFIQKMKTKFKIRSLRGKGRPRKKNRVDPIFLLLPLQSLSL